MQTLTRLAVNASAVGFIALFALLTLSFFYSASIAAQLQLNKGMRHYAQEMEFYYARPRPEILPGLLRSLQESGALERADARLLTASFLAELERNKKGHMANLYTPGLPRNTLHTLAWAAHLGASPLEATIMAELEKRGDGLLVRQISLSPCPLARWLPARETSTLMMFWGAFVATGSGQWINALIDAACKAPGSAPGLSPLQAAAAALLYDYAPGHETIARIIAERLNRSESPDREMLETILRHASGR